VKASGNVDGRLGPALVFALWGLAAAAILTLLLSGGTFLPWHGFLMAVPFLAATAWYGWSVGAFLVPVALLLVWGVEVASGASSLRPASYLELALTMLVATGVGHHMHRVWRESEARAQDNQRRARLLQQAALELNQAEDATHLFSAAPRLLSDILTFTHAELFVPEGDGLTLAKAWRWDATPGFRVPLSSVIGRAYRTGEPQYVPDTQRDSEFMVAPGAEPTRSELALPVKVGSEVRAVINLEHTEAGAFTADDHDALRAFTRIVAEVLERLDAKARLDAELQEQEFLARLSHALLHADDARQAAATAVGELLRFLGLGAGGVLELCQGRLVPIARLGDLSATLASRVDAGFDFAGPLKDAWQLRRQVHIADLKAYDGDAPDFTWLGNEGGVRTAVLCPVRDGQGDVRYLLALATLGEPKPLGERQLKLVSRAAESLGAALSRVVLNRQLFATLDVIGQLARTDVPRTLFQRAAEAAVDLIIGAEAASVLVRDGDLYRFEAAVGYDLDAIREGAGPFTLAEQLRWYGGSEADFRRGIGRIARGDDVVRFSIASSHERTPANLAAARVREMKANIAIPITEGSEVVALLNVDNFSSESAFSASSLRIAEAFAQHIALIVRQVDQVRRLEESLVTDGLTRLGNREGFQRRLEAELARAERYGHQLNLVMVDLDNFKQVNDRFGHAAGDAALVAVADMLKRHLRASDHAFRWAGDEFVLLLPEVRHEEAQAAAERFAELVSHIEVHGLRLSASVGVASYPGDGLDPEALLRRADDLMYDRKLRGRPHTTA